MKYMSIFMCLLLYYMYIHTHTHTHTCSQQYRTVIYNGDVDGCVPFIGNEVSPRDSIALNAVLTIFFIFTDFS